MSFKHLITWIINAGESPPFLQDVEKMLADTPPVWKGSSNLFRNLRERGNVNPSNLVQFGLKSIWFVCVFSASVVFSRPVGPRYSCPPSPHSSCKSYLFLYSQVTSPLFISRMSLIHAHSSKKDVSLETELQNLSSEL